MKGATVEALSTECPPAVRLPGEPAAPRDGRASDEGRAGSGRDSESHRASEQPRRLRRTSLALMTAAVTIIVIAAARLDGALSAVLFTVASIALTALSAAAYAWSLLLESKLRFTRQ